jgi:hypothetical protein
MANYARKYKYCKNLGKMVEITEEGVKEICLELERDVMPIRERIGKVTHRKHSRAKWPIHSEAMAVDPEDIPTARKILAEHGISTEYDRAGRPILTSMAHRKAHAEAMGFYDRNGGYGDPQPFNR